MNENIEDSVVLDKYEAALLAECRAQDRRSDSGMFATTFAAYCLVLLAAVDLLVQGLRSGDYAWPAIPVLVAMGYPLGNFLRIQRKLYRLSRLVCRLARDNEPSGQKIAAIQATEMEKQ